MFWNILPNVCDAFGGLNKWYETGGVTFLLSCSRQVRNGRCSHWMEGCRIQLRVNHRLVVFPVSYGPAVFVVFFPCGFNLRPALIMNR